MTEIVMIDGKHKCGRFMDLRIIDVREDEKDKNSAIISWMIYGVCKKCRTVLMQGLFLKPEKPTLNVDYMITEKIAQEDEETEKYGRFRKVKK